MIDRGKVMLVLAGEQTAPNLLPARHFEPSKVVILHFTTVHF